MHCDADLLTCCVCRPPLQLASWKRPLTAGRVYWQRACFFLTRDVVVTVFREPMGASGITSEVGLGEASNTHRVAKESSAVSQVPQLCCMYGAERCLDEWSSLLATSLSCCNAAVMPFAKCATNVCVRAHPHRLWATSTCLRCT